MNSENPFPYTNAEVRDIHGEVCVFAYNDRGLLKHVRIDVETMAYLVECAMKVGSPASPNSEQDKP